MLAKIENSIEKNIPLIACKQIAAFFSAHLIVKLEIGHLNPLASTLSFVAYTISNNAINILLNRYTENKNNKLKAIIINIITLISSFAIYNSLLSFSQRRLTQLNIAFLASSLGLKILQQYTQSD